MNLVNVEYDDYVAVEESHVGRWRVHNGETYAHGFKTKQQAIEFAERVGGSSVAHCKKIHGKVHYTNVEQVRVREAVK